MNYSKTGTDMKNSLMIIMVTAGFMLGCAGKRTYSRYELLNETVYGIEINSFKKGINSPEGVQKTIIIPPMGEWISVEFETTRGPKLSVFDQEIFGGDSLVIVFDDIKYISNSTFNSDAIPDLIGGGVPTYRMIEYADNKTALRYVFTEADYLNAQLIED